MYTSKPLSGQKGMALAITLLFLLILVMSGSLFFIASQTELQHGSSYTRRIEALSVAESAAERALWRLGNQIGTQSWSAISADEWNTNFGGDTNFIKVASGQYMRVSYPEVIYRGTDYANVKVIATGMLGREEGGKVISISTKQIEIIAKINRTVPLSEPKVFDYAYFINNWGWWYYGGSEHCLGSMRSNGRFDVQSVYNPPRGRVTIDGSVEAHFDADYHSYSPNGLAGLRSRPPTYDQKPYRRPNLRKENIPNLQDMDYYKKIAEGFNPDTGTYDHPSGVIRIGTTTFTNDGVFGDDEPHKNLILIGTNDAPIVIEDSVVIEGNLIIKGVVQVIGHRTGYERSGAIYVGRNVYIAGNIQYVDGPNWSTYPQWQQYSGTDYINPASSTFNMVGNDDGLPGKSLMDTWVHNNATKTLLSVSAKGGLVYGNYSSGDWLSNRWLFNMGSEDVGADGIPGTNIYVNGTWTDPTEGDGIFQPATEDLDGDRVFREGNYTWKDVSTTGGNSNNSEPLKNFAGLGRTADDHGRLWDPIERKYITHYGETATNMISTIDGVYYTQHFLAGRVANSPNFHGSLISKDEVIVYSGVLKLIQDARYHSHYRKDPNFPIYLFPPGSIPLDEEGEILGVLQSGGVLSWKEVR